MKKIIRSILAIILAFPALPQSPTGASPVVVIEGYAFNVEDSIGKNQPLARTKYWANRALAEIARLPKSLGGDHGPEIAAVKVQIETKLKDREAELRILERTIKGHVQQKNLDDAEIVCVKAPIGDKDFDELRETVTTEQQKALVLVKEGKDLAKNNDCHVRDQVREKYQKALKKNKQISLLKLKANVPPACPPFHCGGKCWTAIILTGVAATVGTRCIVDATKGQSCIDRVRK